MMEFLGEIDEPKPDLEIDGLQYFILSYDERTIEVSISKVFTKELTIPETVIVEGKVFKVIKITGFNYSNSNLKRIFEISIPLSLLDIIISNIKSISDMLITINIIQTVNDISLYEDICFLDGEIKFSLITNKIVNIDEPDIYNFKYKFLNSGSNLRLNDLSSNFYFKIPYKMEHVWKIRFAYIEQMKNYQLSEVEYKSIKDEYKNPKQLDEILVDFLDKLNIKPNLLHWKIKTDGMFSYDTKQILFFNFVLKINCPNYDSKTDTLYSADKTKLIKSFNRSSTTFNVPDTVSIISKCAFFNCRDIKYISLPESVSIIEDYAFGNCPNLIEISIKGSLPKNIKIGKITTKFNN